MVCDARVGLLEFKHDYTLLNQIVHCTGYLEAKQSGIVSGLRGTGMQHYHILCRRYNDGEVKRRKKITASHIGIIDPIHDGI